MPRHAGPKPRVTAGRVVLTVVAVACVVGAVVGVVRLDRARSVSDAPSPLAAPATTDGAAPPVPGPDGPVVRAIVVGVADAVTLDVRLPDGRDVVRVRALGIQGPGPCYADESTTFARSVLGTQAVDLIADGTDADGGDSKSGGSRGGDGKAGDGRAGRSGSPTPGSGASDTAAPPGDPGAAPAVDRFDRRLQRVVLDGGRDYAVLAAEAGIARTYSAGAAPATMPPVRDAEARARAAGRGVWGPPCGGRE